MTAQLPERLFHEGRTHPVCSTPLTPYLKQQKMDDIFQVTNTANWRGYVGSWEISNDRLYLVGLSGMLKGGTPAGLETVFPKATDRVFATWYSGVLRVPDGELLEYVHLGFASRYEREILLEIEDGILVNTSVVENKIVGDGMSGSDIDRPYQLRARRGLITRLFELFR